MELLACPPDDLINQATRRRLFFGEFFFFQQFIDTDVVYPISDSRGVPRCITNSKGRKRKPGSKTLSQALRCNDTLFIDFVSKCLEWVEAFVDVKCLLMILSAFRWDPKKRMTPEEAVHHEWLQPSSSSSTFIITSSTSASSLMKHSREQLKENDQSQQQLMQKYQRSQPITPLTILPQIKTPSNRVSQRYNTTNTINGTKEGSRVKGKTSLNERINWKLIYHPIWSFGIIRNWTWCSATAAETVSNLSAAKHPKAFNNHEQ